MGRDRCRHRAWERESQELADRAHLAECREVRTSRPTHLYSSRKNRSNEKASSADEAFNFGMLSCSAVRQPDADAVLDSYTLNEDPQPQVLFTFGFSNLKPAPSSVST